MSAMMKLRQMAVLQRCVWNRFNEVSRTISTSKKNNDVSATASAEVKEEANKNWVSYGWSYTDQQEDTNVHHASFFFSVSLVLVFGGFMWAYSPDVHMRDWAQREAFLELRRREKAGERPISPDFIPKDKMVLPSDEELGDMEIVI